MFVCIYCKSFFRTWVYNPYFMAASGSFQLVEREKCRRRRRRSSSRLIWIFKSGSSRGNILINFSLVTRPTSRKDTPWWRVPWNSKRRWRELRPQRPHGFSDGPRRHLGLTSGLTSFIHLLCLQTITIRSFIIDYYQSNKYNTYSPQF